MLKFTQPIPLSLYIHFPWCVRKCPYCDFNSHALKNELPEADYIKCLIQDLKQDMSPRKLHSIFLGGGTPSLFSANALAQLFAEIPREKTIEITMEANPGTFEQKKFSDFRNAGINRLSIGVQSFDNEKLKALGRIHDATEAINAIEQARDVGFENMNIDIMYGLPKQTYKEALADLQQAIDLQPQHISWYQLTLEPNTLFYHQPPPLPKHDALWEIEVAGKQLLKDHGYIQYEVSAYAKEGFTCQHNKNYWEFGDYLGIGAGAHAKITKSNSIIRTSKLKHPKAYMQTQNSYIASTKTLTPSEIIFEFMLNALRLQHPISFDLFSNRTGLNKNSLEPTFDKANAAGLLEWDNEHFWPSERGRDYLNELLELFL